MIPYHCDALLDPAQRYASLRYRRVAQRIELRLLTWADAAELVGFVETIGLRHARYILRWRGQAVVRAYRRLRKHIGDAAHPYIQANQSEMGVDTGLAVLRAMQDGGWTHGRLPWVVKMALKELRKSNTIAAIARETGLSREQVKTACDVRRDGRLREQASASGALMLG